MEEMWCHQGNDISVRFECDETDLMRSRDVSADDIPMDESERRSGRGRW